MSNPLRTPEDYELFLYTITEQFPSVKRYGYCLVIRERVLYHQLPAVIDWYGYEVWQNDDKLYWYGSQPHPNDPTLTSTHPHHKHVPPNIKRNRIPAPTMSFERPNLSTLIEEIEVLIAQDRHPPQPKLRTGGDCPVISSARASVG